MSDPGAVAIVTEHVTGAYGFTMKTAANEFLHRVLPLRDPDQHRFWCVVVVRCTAGGLPVRSEPPWIGRRGLRREELSETMEAIRADLSGWLAQPEQTELRELVLVPGDVAGPLVPSGEPPGLGQAAPHAAPSGLSQVLDSVPALRGHQQALG